MKPRRTEHSNQVFDLPGGNEDNSLWAILDSDQAGDPLMRSTWVPTDEERAAIAAGSNVELIVWGTVHPPVAMMLDDSQILGATASGHPVAE